MALTDQNTDKGCISYTAASHKKKKALEHSILSPFTFLSSAQITQMNKTLTN